MAAQIWPCTMQNFTYPRHPDKTGMSRDDDGCVAWKTTERHGPLPALANTGPAMTCDAACPVTPWNPVPLNVEVLHIVHQGIDHDSGISQRRVHHHFRITFPDCPDFIASKPFSNSV